MSDDLVPMEVALQKFEGALAEGAERLGFLNEREGEFSRIGFRNGWHARDAEVDEACAQLAEATAQLTLATKIIGCSEAFDAHIRDCEACKFNDEGVICDKATALVVMAGRARKDFLANPNPLAAAVARVVAAAGKWRDTDEDMETIESLEEAVDALRALAPWWPS